ncbi:hypothetical protein AURDEDRAFT_57877 [Auricularia subglabra TFB-10046 SS5]|nr:hypothetical protein AURDEDRAFT_57877 [Auricularia subglabra TFB-10046 SS5]
MRGMGSWTTSKWTLLLSIITVFSYGIVGFTLTLLTWYQAFEHADVFYVTNFDIIVFLLFATLLVLVTSIIGMTGTLLSSRPILAFYAMLLFPAFVSLLIPAYAAYKRANFSLDRKLNLAWSQWWTDRSRLVVQNSLHCCGYYTPLHQAVYSSKCYPRVPLHGCKSALLAYEGRALRKLYTTLFALAPLHIVNMVVALLCANHVTSTFGKGLTPKHYRLTAADVRENSELVLAFLTEQRRAEEHLQRASLARPPVLQVHAMERDDSRPRSWNGMGWGRQSLGNGTPIG